MGNNLKKNRISIIANSLIALYEARGFSSSTEHGMSGGSRIFIECAKRWLDKGISIDVFTPDVGEEFCKYNGLNRANYVTWASSGFSTLGAVVLYIIGLVRGCLITLGEPQQVNKTIVYSSSDFLPDVLPAFVYKLKNRKAKWIQVIYHLIPHPSKRVGSSINNVVSYCAQRLSFQLIKRHSDLIFVLNNIIVGQLVKLGFHKDKIHVIGAGIDLAHINKIPKIKEAEYDACFLGRLHPAKGIFDLIEIWKLVVSKRENARLAVIYVGSKDLESALMKRIRERNLEANVFMLPLTGDDALRVVKSSKIFVFPSHEEGWGIAVCEAMACGLPVIAYDLPIYREIYTQGIIQVPLNDIKLFSEEVVSLLENDEKRFTLGEKAEAQASKYDWDDVASGELLLMTNI
jgi:glycosyltransferase involved in cell wall biosynthesis